jgi:hypothetical protein
LLLNRDFDPQPASPAPPASTLTAQLQALPTEAHWAIKTCFTHGSIEEIVAAFRNGTAMAVSDGSFKLNLGTSGYIISTASGSSFIQGVNRTPGPLKDGDSYRAELSGLYALLLLGNTLAKAYNFTNGRCVIACDNDAAIRVCKPGFKPDPSKDCFDLINAIYILLQESPITWIATQVDGHKDRVSSTFTPLELLNMRMDKLAKSYLRFLADKEDTWATDYSIPIHGEGWQLWNGTTKIRHASKDALYSIIQDPITISYWVRHNRIPSESTHMIDWEANGRAFKAMKLGKRRRVSKHASHDCGVGTTLVKWKLQDDDACPRCGQSETTEHVIRCPQAIDQWGKELDSLISKLTSMETDPEIQDCMVHSLKSWHAGHGPFQMNAAQNPLLLQALREQHRIGWFPFIEGLISTTWQKAQALHYSSIDTKRTSPQWSRRLIQLLHTLTDNMWQHRNEIKHISSQPRQKRMRYILHQEIAKEFMTGPSGLPRGDSSRFFDHNIVTLLQSSTKYQLAWLHNLAQARQRHKRKLHHDDELSTISKQQSQLFKWARTGVAS